MNAIKSIYTPFFISFDKNRPIVQKTFLAMTALCSIASCFRPMRVSASIGMRTLSFLSVGISKTSGGAEGLLIKIAKLSTITLGIAAITTSKPGLLVASLAGDIGLQMIETIQAICNKDGTKALMHVNVLFIDALTLGGFVLGSWKLMVAAAAVSAVSMFVMSAIANATGHGDDTLSYLVLMGVNIFTALTIGERVGLAKTAVIKNEDPTGKLIVMKPDGTGVVAESAPGQDVTIQSKGPHKGYFKYDVLHVSENGEMRLDNFMVPQEVYRHAMPTSEFSSLSLGGGILKPIEPNVDNYKQQGPFAPLHF